MSKSNFCSYASPMCHRGTPISAGFTCLCMKHILFKSKSNTLSNFPQKHLHAREVSLNRVLQPCEAYITLPTLGPVQSIVHEHSSIRVPSKIVYVLSEKILQNGLQEICFYQNYMGRGLVRLPKSLMNLSAF